MTATVQYILFLFGLFVAHWEQVNAALSAPLTLTGGMTLTQFRALRDALNTAAQNELDAEASEKAARNARTAKRDAMLAILARVRHAATARLAGNPLLAQFPLQPKGNIADAALILAVRAFIAAWKVVDAALGANPLVLAGPYALADLEDDLDALISLLGNLEDKMAATKDARQAREAKVEECWARFKEYRNVAFDALYDHPELQATIPTLDHRAEPGPANPVAAGEWVMPGGMAHFTWTIEDATGIVRWLIRARAGTEAPAEADELVDTLTDPDAREWFNGSLWTAEQPTWTLRVWAVDENGHVAASNPVTITRVMP